ncbi:MAG: IS4 family transposase, partial [Tatlockia sp.]|nr:IS4 family transposase [Tatlockia sp.]
WEQTLTQIGTPQNNWVNVGNRGNDIFTFIRFCKNSSWNYVIRAKHNRKIITQNNQQEKLFVWIKSLPQKAVKTITLNQQEIELSISWEKIKISTPKNGFKKSNYEEIEVWCIRCWQENNNLEWVLLTNIPILSTDEALEKIEWYKSRWLIEEYHKCLKTGCNIEKRQLTTAHGLLSLLALLSIIATKLIELKFLVRNSPEDKARNAIPQLILRMICARFRLSEESVTLRQVWHKIANLGGFIGRKSDGDPGWQTLWKGWLRVLDMVAGAESLSIPKCG